MKRPWDIYVLDPPGAVRGMTRPIHCTSSYHVACQLYQKLFNVGFRIIGEKE